MGAFLPHHLTAHPLDISLSVLEVSDNQIVGTIYIHPYELTLVAEEHGIDVRSEGFESVKPHIINYFKERFVIHTAKRALHPYNIHPETTELYQILADGLYLNYSFNITRSDYPVTFDVRLFLEYFSTQTNKLIFVNRQGEMLPGSEEVFLTVKRPEWEFDLRNPDFSTEKDDLTDSDEDGLTDHQETIYGFDPNDPDTDDDGYSDFTEMSYGWDPLDPQPSPGQSEEVVRNNQPTYQTGYTVQEDRVTAGEPSAESTQTAAEKSEAAASSQADSEEPAAAASRSTTDESAATTSGPAASTSPPGDSEVASTSPPVPGESEGGRAENLIKKHNIRDKNIPDSTYLQKTLGKLQRAITGGGNFLTLISVAFSVFVLGFLHASMPGHGKGILFSYLTQIERKFTHALRFIITFTVTHLADVIILSLGLTFLASSYSSARISTILKYAGGIGLVALSLFLIYRGIQDVRGKSRQGKKPTGDKAVGKAGTKGAVLLGFLTGLAPCPFGWAIILLLMSLGKLQLVPVVIAIFGLGIFIFLLIVTVGFFIARSVASRIFDRYARYSQLISGILLLGFALLFFSSKIPTIS